MLKKLLAIRCVADHSRGYGHFSRCLAIANYFSKRDYELLFLINNDVLMKIKLSKIKLNFFIVPKFKTTSSEGKFLKKFVVENSVSCLMIDMREFSEKLSKEITNCNCLTVVIDDSTVCKVYSDILLNGNPIKKYHEYKLFNKKSKLLLGTKFFITNPNFSKNKKTLSEITSKKKYNVTISCGGTDINKITWKIAKQIFALSNIQIQVIIGPLMKNKQNLKLKKPIKIVHSPDKIWKNFNSSDLVICTSGSTLFELAIQGIPCINIAAVKHQIPYGLEFSKSKFGIYMGYWNELDFSKIKLVTEELLSNTSKRKHMSSTGKRLIDGKGLERFEKVVSSMIN
jgi:spore coat polysaccharide biosynthesis predicted glycosyltransferase SpsG